MGAAVWANTGVLLKVFNLGDEILPQPGFVVLPVFRYFHQAHSSIREEQVRVPVARVKNVEITITEKATQTAVSMQIQSWKFSVVCLLEGKMLRSGTHLITLMHHSQYLFESPTKSTHPVRKKSKNEGHQSKSPLFRQYADPLPLQDNLFLTPPPPPPPMNFLQIWDCFFPSTDL